MNTVDAQNMTVLTYECPEILEQYFTMIKISSSMLPIFYLNVQWRKTYLIDNGNVYLICIKKYILDHILCYLT